MRETVADTLAESRIVKSILHSKYSDLPEPIKRLLAIAPEGFEVPTDGQIAAAYEAARKNGGNIAAYLDSDHALMLEIYQTSKEAEPPSEVLGDVSKMLAKFDHDRLRFAAAEADLTPRRASRILQELVQKVREPAGVLATPTIIDAAAFVAEAFTRPDELIDGLLHRGEKMALGGGSKSFKTWTLLDLALSVAHGQPWLGKATKAGRVLYLNFEIQLWSWQSRIATVARAKGITIEPGRLSVWNLRGKAATFDYLVPKIRDAAQTDYALIILDPVYKLYGQTDENSAGDVARLLNGLEELAVSTGSAVAFGAHFSKGNQSAKESIDRISGSGVFARDPDSLLMFTRHEAADAFTVEATLRNFAPVEPFVVRWQHPLMVRADDLDPSKLKQVGGRKPAHEPEDLLRLLPPGGSLAKAWISDAESDGISRRTFFRLKKSLEQADKVIQDRVTLLWKPVKTAQVS